MSNKFVKKIVSISSFVAIIIAALIIIYYTTWIFAVDKFVIRSESMMPTIIPGDQIVVNKLLFGARIYSCITVAEDFLIANYKKPDYLFILTNINSLKIINNKIGENVSQLSNVILDYDNSYSQYNMPIYPIVINFNCKEMKVKSIVYQKPDSNAFDKI